MLGLEIGLTSVENIGTKISVCEIEITSPQKPVVALKFKIGKLSNNRVLIIDDNKQVVEGMQRLIEKWGYNVEVQDPNAVLSKQFDILLIDFHLNEPKNGIELAANIKEKYQCDFPTAIISGTMNLQMEKLAKLEGYWTLQKPVAPMQLRSVLIAMSASLSQTDTQNALN